MKAVLQNFKTGDMAVEDVPPPSLKADGVLVANVASLVSAGTEKAVIELAKMNPLQKAKARPDLVKKVLSKAGQEGLLATSRIVMNLVSAPLPLGYSCAGYVTQVGDRVSDISPGQRVACAGLGYANHAEVTYIPRNLLVPIPDNVSFEEAAFVTVGAIALHGVRQAALTLGETVVVIGMGLVGQIAAQICNASGCRVFCIDLDPSKVALAKTMGVDNGMSGGDTDTLKAAVMAFTGRRGADAVLITAGTKSSGPIELAPELSRDRARVVAIGDVGHNVPRRAYYEKEIDLRQSRSYGPGRYDPQYEEKGHDYPISYVRWTENRNMEAFIDLIARDKIQIKPLLTHRFEIEEAQKAYDLLLGDVKEPYVGILLDYDPQKEQPSLVDVTEVPTPTTTKKHGQVSMGIIGAGQFAQGVLLPALKSVDGVNFRAFATGSGLTSVNVARKYNAQICTSDFHQILSDKDVDAVLIATRHDTHADMVVSALQAGKHCFVEKPMAINDAGLEAVIAAQKESGKIVLAGFNRRFSPLAKRLRTEMSGAPLVMQYRVNAGFIPVSHWHQDVDVGGGRIVGEVCHFIDVMQFISNAAPVSVGAQAISDGTGIANGADPDNIVITIQFDNGSVGTVAYVSSGDPSFPKERLEVFGGGKVGVIDNWRTIHVSGNGQKYFKRYWMQAEKGHTQEMAAFIKGIREGVSPISFESQILTTKATFAIQESLREGRSIQVLL